MEVTLIVQQSDRPQCFHTEYFYIKHEVAATTTNGLLVIKRK